MKREEIIKDKIKIALNSIYKVIGEITLDKKVEKKEQKEFDGLVDVVCGDSADYL